ncbi:hypothetical protein G3I59_35940 [Amycolatopsis rubida]|uniref:Uncharacterized protein n=1 Tax=Amycolatopsis rubida TaxID=112413 RepID=A0A1I5QVR6_9PSEU|nr:MULTISPECIES: hypothetical protein [Amycolatopsis]MYW95855.1 hypothetical protein [Amycolatopsis rubida]NEC60845.1 hypothetical protein [Amycolatopsis rubida]OAP26685.1 hypothetical protein A4R44_02672 [Amycolatopsis sp. M39]SFP50210.1 hypothetical protein SAMN05421854_105456 [Amycolatopsis rubida]
MGASALLLTVAACGGNGTVAAPVSSGPPSGSVPVSSPPPSSPPVSPPPVSAPPKSRPTQGVPPGDTAPAAGQINASALPAGYPHDVTLAEGGSVVVIQAEEGGCDKLSAKAGEQTATQVAVLVTITKAPHGQMCPMHVREISLPVRLAAPLGGRELVLKPGP